MSMETMSRRKCLKCIKFRKCLKFCSIIKTTADVRVWKFHYFILNKELFITNVI